ncbi:MAG: hypothetical protein ACRENU_13380, partial [Gemmatimonadaceae bacterium]
MTGSRRRLRRRSVLGSRLAALVLIAACRDTQESAAATVAQTVPAANVSESRRTAITRAVERVAPAVVTVQTEAEERVVDPFFGWPFGQSSGSRVVPGLGS